MKPSKELVEMRKMVREFLDANYPTVRDPITDEIVLEFGLRIARDCAEIAKRHGDQSTERDILAKYVGKEQR